MLAPCDLAELAALRSAQTGGESQLLKRAGTRASQVAVLLGEATGEKRGALAPCALRARRHARTTTLVALWRLLPFCTAEKHRIPRRALARFNKLTRTACLSRA